MEERSAESAERSNTYAHAHAVEDNTVVLALNLSGRTEASFGW